MNINLSKPLEIVKKDNGNVILSLTFSLFTINLILDNENRIKLIKELLW